MSKGCFYCKNYLKDDGNFDGKVCSHGKCRFIAHNLRDFARDEDDYDFRWTSDKFLDAIYDYCSIFVCPTCEQYDKRVPICFPVNCIDKVYTRLKEYKLVPVVDWKEVKI